MLRVCLGAAVLAFAALSGCAQETPEDATADATGTETGGIVGVVVDAAIRPLVGANVTLDPTGEIVQTDAQGSFAFPGLAPGGYLVRVNATGFLDSQLPVEVLADLDTAARITLLAVERTDPFVLTVDFEGFVQASAGLLTPVIDEASRPTGFESCTQCSFQVTPDPGLSRMVLEATWTDSITNPTGPTEYIWSVTADQTGATVQGTSAAPLFRVLGTLDFAAEEFDFSSSATYTVSIYPDAAWPAASQSYDAFLSMWYRGPPPADWRIIQP